MKIRFKLRAILLLMIPVCVLLAWVTSVVDGNWDAFASGWHGSMSTYFNKSGEAAERLGNFLHFAAYAVWALGGILLLLFCVINLFMDRD